VALLFLAWLPLLTTACSTHEALQRQRLAIIDDQLAALEETRHFLEQTPRPDLSSDVSLFLSADTLNQVLATPNPIEIPLPTGSTDKLTITRVTIAFDGGLPLVHVNATATRASANLTVRLSITAWLNLDLSPHAQGNPATVQLRITDLVPDVRWGPFAFSKIEFIKDLLALKITQTLQDKLPKYAVPLSASTVLNAPAMARQITVSTGRGSVSGELSNAGFSTPVSMTISRVLFLSDGLHVYGSVAFR
jgi:hypothetical protein